MMMMMLQHLMLLLLPLNVAMATAIIFFIFSLLRLLLHPVVGVVVATNGFRSKFRTQLSRHQDQLSILPPELPPLPEPFRFSGSSSDTNFICK